jgi:hypothetical protein
VIVAVSIGVIAWCSLMVLIIGLCRAAATGDAGPPGEIRVRDQRRHVRARRALVARRRDHGCPGRATRTSADVRD